MTKFMILAAAALAISGGVARADGGEIDYWFANLQAQKMLSAPVSVAQAPAGTPIHTQTTLFGQSHDASPPQAVQLGADGNGR